MNSLRKSPPTLTKEWEDLTHMEEEWDQVEILMKWAVILMEEAVITTTPMDLAQDKGEDTIITILEMEVKEVEILMHI